MHTLVRGHRTHSAGAFFASVLAMVAGQTVIAADVSHGELAAAIRSAGLPCAHVQAVSPAGSDAWRVTCNSGSYRVTRNPQGGYAATRTD